MPLTSAGVASRITLLMRSRALLLPISNPALFDQVRVDLVGILVAQQVTEAFHPRRRQQPLHHDVLERNVQAIIEPAQVRGTARAQLVTAAALLDELDLSGVDLRLG